MRSYQRRASEHGISCSHREPSLYGCGEVRSKGEHEIMFLSNLSRCMSAFQVKLTVYKHYCLVKRVRVTMTVLTLVGPKFEPKRSKKDIPKVELSSPTLHLKHQLSWGQDLILLPLCLQEGDRAHTSSSCGRACVYRRSCGVYASCPWRYLRQGKSFKSELDHRTPYLSFTKSTFLCLSNQFSKVGMSACLIGSAYRYSSFYSSTFRFHAHGWCMYMCLCYITLL